MNDITLKKYCELIIKAGVNLYEGQCLHISSGIKNADYAVQLAKTAYENGAKYVEVSFFTKNLTKFRIENLKSDDFLKFIPNYPVGKNFELISNDWAYVSIDNLEELGILSGVSADKLSDLTKIEQESGKAISKAVSSSKIAWCIAAFPGPAWASKVFKNGHDNTSISALEESLIKILRLDKPNPVKEWLDHAENLNTRSKKLTAMKLDKLHFESKDTNLEIGLNENSEWRGGIVKASNGRNFIPNLPTEEVFTTPDFKRTNGKAKVTRPVKVLENILDGIWFEFKNGKVVNFGCNENAEILEKFINTDDGSSFLGEIALVDSSSEVYKSGLTFNSILYDENAACHMALGRGILSCMSNRDEINTNDDMIKSGCNYSMVHTDFMIGSDEIDVTGFDKSGSKTEIIKKGKFVI